MTGWERFRIPLQLASSLLTLFLVACGSSTGPIHLDAYNLAFINGRDIVFCQTLRPECDFIRGGGLTLATDANFVLTLQTPPTVLNPEGNETIAGTYDVSGASIEYRSTTAVFSGSVMSVEGCPPHLQEGDMAVTFLRGSTVLLFCPSGAA